MRRIDLKKELNALGMPFALIGYETKAPAYPYGIYLETIDVHGGNDEMEKRIVNHAVTIELYHKTDEGLFAACEILETWLDSLPLDYHREMTYIPEDDHLLASYTTNYTTKKKKG